MANVKKLEKMKPMKEKARNQPENLS